MSNQNLVPEQEAWLGKMQVELGVLSSNIWLLEIQKERLTQRVLADAEFIALLKERIRLAEKANEELKEQIQPHRMKKKPDGKNPI